MKIIQQNNLNTVLSECFPCIETEARRRGDPDLQLWLWKANNGRLSVQTQTLSPSCCALSSMDYGADHAGQSPFKSSSCRVLFLTYQFI